MLSSEDSARLNDGQYSGYLEDELLDKIKSAIIPLLLFQDFNKFGFSDHRIVSDDRDVQISGCGGNKPIMKFRDVGYLGSGFENLHNERLELIILAF